MENTNTVNEEFNEEIQFPETTYETESQIHIKSETENPNENLSNVNSNNIHKKKTVQSNKNEKKIKPIPKKLRKYYV